ncbi:MAG: hypothetical protein ACTSPV_00575 [Candidatus Hodarchaeales archaeon]
MSEALWIVIIVNFLGMLTVWGKAYFDYKARKTIVKKNEINGKRNKLNNPGPGKAQICIDNGKTLVRLETDIENMKGDIQEIRRKLNHIK